MKHLIILGDGMSDHPVASLGGKTPLQYASTPNFDRLAREGRCGLLETIPDGFAPGSEVANTAILGYDLNEVYEAAARSKPPASATRWSRATWPCAATSSP